MLIDACKVNSMQKDDAMRISFAVVCGARGELTRHSPPEGGGGSFAKRSASATVWPRSSCHA
jgi:hypothetical protein